MFEHKSHVYIKTDENNNIIRIEGEYSLPSDLSGWILIEEGSPCDRLNHAQTLYLEKPIMDFEYGVYNYEYINGEVVEKDNTEEIEEVKRFRAVEEIRRRREEECFPVINRGSLWFNKLTVEQTEELSEWYDAWLNAPETGVIPEKPAWV